MQAYKDFRPTGFDPRGISLPDQQNWLVLPCGQNRDSNALDRSNFECALEELGGESDAVEIHRFGHWACGWFEIIIVDPASEKAAIAFEIEAALENYPVLNEEHFSELEYSEVSDYWARMSVRDRIEYLARADLSIFWRKARLFAAR